jgi:hypothetical protein
MPDATAVYLKDAEAHKTRFGSLHLDAQGVYWSEILWR